MVTTPSPDNLLTDLQLPDNLEQQIHDEYAAIAFSNLFDLLTITKRGLTLNQKELSKSSSLRAVAALQWHKTPSGTKLNIKMHNKLEALKYFAYIQQQKQFTNQITASQLLAISPDQLAKLISEINQLE